MQATGMHKRGSFIITIAAMAARRERGAQRRMQRGRKLTWQPLPAAATDKQPATSAANSAAPHILGAGNRPLPFFAGLRQRRARASWRCLRGWQSGTESVDDRPQPDPPACPSPRSYRAPLGFW